MKFPRTIGMTICAMITTLTPFNLARAEETPFPPIINSQDPKDVPLTPEEALKKISLPPGFNVTLFAGDPDVRQPIGMATDARGRLWVAENYSYGGGAQEFDPKRRDRIIVLEDSQNKGHFDKRTVFWDDAHRLTSVEVGMGGVWALCPPNLYFIPDHDGDGIPDGEPRIVLDGWNAGVIKHTIANGLRWGPDGWLYGRQGIQGVSSVGKPGAPESERVKINCGIWRYHPTRKIFEVVAEGTTNPWGFDYNDRGQMFFINTVIGHLWHVIPGAHFKRMYGEDANPHVYELIDQHADHVHWATNEKWDDVRKGVTGATSLAGGGHAHTGLMFYLGGNWPDQYRDTLFTINFHGRRFNNDIIERSGSGYVGHHGKDFFQSEDLWFRGIDLLYGPDGGVFVSDWSDYGECHDSDGVHRTSGRIYKITYGQPSSRPTKDLAQLTDSELVELQLEKNDWYVRQSRKLLQERAANGADMSKVHHELRKMFDQQTEVPRQLRAIWADYAIGGADDAWLAKQLSHPSEDVRAWAVRLLMDGKQPSEETIIHFVERAKNDQSGLVRLFLASALQRIEPKDRTPLAAALLAHSEDASDHNMPLMLWYGIEPIVSAAPNDALKLAEASQIPLVRRFIARRLTEEIKTDPGRVNALLETAAANPSALFEQDVLQGMSESLHGWNKAKAPSAWTKATTRLDSSPLPETRQLLRELGLAFGEPSAVNELRAAALDKSAATAARVVAARTLLDNHVPGLLPFFEELLTNNPTAIIGIQGMMSENDADIPKRIIARLETFSPEEKRQAAAVLISRAAGANALLDAIASKELDRSILTPFQARQIRNLHDERINQKLGQTWGEMRATAPDKVQLMKSYKAALTEESLKQADLANGRQLFNTACAVCHTLFGEGAKIGPDLTGSGRANLDYLLENILDPSAIVGADFRVSIVTLKDGRVLNGIYGAKSDQTVMFQTPGEVMRLDRSDITKSESSNVSLMPEGLLEALDASQVRDLLAYLMSPHQTGLPSGSSAKTGAALEP